MAKKKARIVVVGSANVDLTTFTNRLPRRGETIFGERFDLGFGGKGANQAVAAALLGAEVHMVARVGDDLFGPATVRNLKSFGVRVRHVKKVKKTASGVAPIFVDEAGQNRILVVKGANDRLTPRAVSKAKRLLRSADLLVLQLEIPLETVYHAVALAKKHHVRVLLNPAPAAELDLGKVKDVDYLVPNESEAESIAKKPVTSVAEAKECARELLQKGFRKVLLTLGERGAIFAGSDTVALLPAYDVKAVDSTGAGDAFVGSFAAFLGQGIPEREAIARANLYAALSTTGVGTQKSFATRRDFDKAWRKRSKREKTT